MVVGWYKYDRAPIPSILIIIVGALRTTTVLFYAGLDLWIFCCLLKKGVGDVYKSIYYCRWALLGFCFLLAWMDRYGSERKRRRKEKTTRWISFGLTSGSSPTAEI